MDTKQLMEQIDIQRQLKKVSKNTIEKGFGISQRHYNKALAGQGSISVDKLVTLCKALDLTLTISLNH